MALTGDPAALIKKLFPYGAQASTSKPDAPDFQVTDLEVEEGADGPVLFGWAYPNKDMYFRLDNAEETERGLLVHKISSNVRYILTPLSERVGHALSANLKDV